MGEEDFTAARREGQGMPVVTQNPHPLGGIECQVLKKEWVKTACLKAGVSDPIYRQ